MLFFDFFCFGNKSLKFSFDCTQNIYNDLTYAKRLKKKDFWA